MSKLVEFFGSSGLSEMNLHLGCGGERFKGWINVDLYPFDASDSSRSGADIDVEMDILELDCPDNSVDNILMVHVFEHFVRWDGIRLLEQCYRVLKPQGRLYIETPDLDKCIEIYLKGGSERHMQTPIGSLNIGFTQLYGNQWDELDYETHRYVWTQRELRYVAESIGWTVESLTNDAKFHVKGRDIFCILRK